jgi:galactokinase
VPTGRTLVVKARPRDDAAVNVWLDRQRAPLPPDVGATLAEHGIGPGGADVVIETEPGGAPGGLALTVVDAELPDPPDRDEECRRAADELGLERLDQAAPDAILRLDDETLKARTRHVITETARVRAARRAIGSGAWAQLGTILTASHESLRDDLEVSRAELDVAAEAALEAGALGARLRLALVPADRVAAVRDLVQQRFDGAGWPRPDVRVVPFPETLDP